MALYQTVHKGIDEETGERCTLIALLETPNWGDSLPAENEADAIWNAARMMNVVLLDSRIIYTTADSDVLACRSLTVIRE